MSEQQKPRVFVSSIKFNDGTELSLDQNSIVVFTGANNSGKSQVLRDIENQIKNPQSLSIIAENLNITRVGNLDDKFILAHRRSDEQGNIWIGNNGAPLSQWQSNWSSSSLYNLSALFVGRLDTKERLTVSESKPLFGISPHEVRNSLHTVYEDNEKEALISRFFFEAFGEKLVVNRRAGQLVSLHVGNPPDRDTLKMNDEGVFYNKVAQLPKLDTQGDGMRSFASVLLDNFTSEHSLTLIDEPEAFLHPPQARLLGKLLAKYNPSKRQLFISTHSEDFLQGLLDAENENVTIIRIDRQESINHMSVLKSENIKKLWSSPILRYSNILSGLFHDKVVVCESDYDCLFYQAIMDAMSESRGEIAPDILFTHCGGKDRIHSIVSALKAVNVSVVAVFDFDVLNDSRKFKEIVTAFGKDYGSLLSANMKIIYDTINANNNTNNAWDGIKKIGKASFTGEAPKAYESVESVCRATGLFIVPVGEMECFDKTVNKEKKEWVYYILENYDLAKEAKLEEARKFVQAIIAYTPNIEK